VMMLMHMMRVARSAEALYATVLVNGS